VRRVSSDGTFVIVELDPGTAVAPGDLLLVPSENHPLSRLRVTELEAPYFAADIVEGVVAVGDRPKR
jgi:hypothetical protein